MKEFIKAIFAGIMIGIAALTSIGAGGSYQGALLFSIGLVCIILCQYNLYTGKIGYIQNWKEIPKYLLYILGNFIGVFLISLTTNVSTKDIIELKLNIPLYSVFLKAIGCGFLMYLAVDTYKQHKTLLGTIGCVAAFILSGFEHSIADMFYICCGNIYNLNSLIFIITVIIGNAIGALLHKLIN